MFRKLNFEEEAYSELKQIPFSTQYKLHSLGVKLRPESWNSLSLEARQLFCQIPIKSEQDKECYRNYLFYLLKRRRRQIHLLEPGQVEREKAKWENPVLIPNGVYQEVVDLGFTLSPRDWLEMGEFQRFVLVQLSEGNYDRDYVAKALVELLPLRAKISTWKKKTAIEPFPGEALVPVASKEDHGEAVLSAS
jgi:hypothetical protein